MWYNKIIYNFFYDQIYILQIPLKINYYDACLNLADDFLVKYFLIRITA